MNANELRIGNHIMFGERIISVSHHDISNMVKMNITEGSSDIYKPIPLTEYWLKRAGFEKKMNSTWRNDEFMIWISPDNKFADLYFHGHMIKMVYSVHEWQNLTFALTGDELQFTQP